MTLRIGCAFILSISCFALVASTSAQQVVRFDTTAGDFDMVLNPTGDSRLDEHVENFISYVTNRRYHCTVINRADEDFVLQMGSFRADSLTVPETVDGFRAIRTFDPITGVPAAETGLTNSRGTVSLALPGLPTGGTDRDGGTSSFFVNLGDNSFLDTDFTVFGVVPDLTTIDAIMALDQVDLTLDPNSGAGPGNLAFSDIPIHSNGNMVFIQRAFQVTDTMTVTAATNAALALLDNPPSAGSTLTAASSSSAATGSIVPPEVPEPAAAVMALLATMAALFCRWR